MPRGPTKRRPKTTAALLSAARDVFAERGFHGSTIGEISGRAGLTTGAFYSNFDSKDALFLALFDQHSQDVVERLKNIVSEALRSEDPIAALVAAMSEGHGEEPGWFLLSMEYTLHAIRNPVAARALADHDRRLRKELVQLLALLLERSGRRDDVDLDMLARLLVAIHEGSLAQSLVERDTLPVGELERTYLATILHSVLAGDAAARPSARTKPGRRRSVRS
ncbi:TetR/AcrR family transcriptional regulator [Mycobacterium sp. Aquia_216]|uniref:TetR/AcrR family transcriptional regulator n=1 Tax=Mycobacterium sp. Aquia_216 TaxID=2991729 RepID=UPI00227CC24D|nr:TetR/AcrR family transcriptional regulator [Mycobacterium sp. Aquia_216]WAJ44752.1 TetR/AcrR family transcriptional regulator [Mycobacterium sp. Aquia_216]